ncbi:MAG: tRNA (adenosine(37)-N6)-threonylcarbamoyltransferase complex ATPase subunit type 1 TsaE [Alphaproteobacteria bacterium]|nr:tRNA (adenosine(37)-N6)-threonylcarbamoyltransferase complex ATPase subunit type 1 TsaE [Alphaproteobacteria bacterium]NNF24187.1 tRNA (adenosine(37)-N6)-threonylcarbamoyltransferase complex ATPase subunit type 1 TsaE [Paracoccaceae bacterium]
MSSRFTASFHLPSERATAQFAATMAPLLGPGDCLLLKGPVGAGKSHFARSLIQARLAARGLEEDVPSPTFTLVQTYSDGITEIWHADLYRLSDTSEVVELGLEDAFQTAISMIEWPEKLGDLTPPNALSLRFSPGKSETARDLEISGPTGWQRRLVPIMTASVGAHE